MMLLEEGNGWLLSFLASCCKAREKEDWLVVMIGLPN